MEPRTSKSYQEAVLRKYKKDKGGEMRGYLAAPTCSQIRDACMYLLDRRDEKNDAYILTRFFEFKTEHNRLKEIENFGLGKFKAIEKFLKGDIKQTSTKNINLISWLIDFQPRPYEEYLKSDFHGPVHESTLSANTHKKAPKIADPQTTYGTTERIKKRKPFWITIPIIIVIVLLLTISFLKVIRNGSNHASKQPQCMAWADSLYMKVPCSSKPYSQYGTKVEPLDITKLKNFKKVEVNMATQFFSEDDKPLLWYYKNKEGEIEYFTAPGLHPTNDETLRKITPYIIQTYVPVHSFQKDSFLE
ncbi:hypothetical protein [Flagellimonas sp.]|uniref:hypothetical protein n=1 Tax=Flagellimonas sp. TaxID=2058762 RepID=UPI003C7E30EB